MIDISMPSVMKCYCRIYGTVFRLVSDPVPPLLMVAFLYELPHKNHQYFTMLIDKVNCRKFIDIISFYNNTRTFY